MSRSVLGSFGARVSVVAGMAITLFSGVIVPAAHATTLYQATNVHVTANNPGPNFDRCHYKEAFPTDGQANDGGVESNIGNYKGELTTSFDFPVNLQSGSIQITAPQGPRPAAVTAANAPWGTQFPTISQTQNDAAAASYGCTLAAGEHFQIIKYWVVATFPSGSAQPGTWNFPAYPSVSTQGNQVTIPFNFTGYGQASHLTVYIADVVNPVKGTYNGVQYSVLVNDPGGQYSDVPAPSQNSVTYVSTSPDRQASQLTESVPNGGSTITATNDPAAGATITVTIYDQYYNPVAGEPIFIGVYSGSGVQTQPVSQGGGNGEPVTDAGGQASYYAWGTLATSAGNPDLFFGQDTAQNSFFIENSQGHEATVPLSITAGVPNPPSAGGPYTSSIQVYPQSSPTQSTTITVDDTATISINLVDQFNNPLIDHAIAIVPILSQNQTSNNFKGVIVQPGSPPGSYDNTTGQNFACAQGPASEVPGASCTDGNGSTSFTVTDTKTQTVSFEITDLTNGSTLPYTDLPPADQSNIPVVTFTAGPTSLATSTVNVNGGQSANILANGTNAATIHVTLRDDKGNPEPGKTVSLDGSNAISTITPLTGVTDANGSVSFSVTSPTLGSTTYTATDVTDSLVLNGPHQQPVVHFITGAVSSTLSTVTVNPSTVVGDGQGAAVVSVTVVDEGGHALAGQTVALDSSSYPDLTVVQPSAVTDSNGLATFTVRSPSVIDVSLPVNVGATSPVVLSTTADITFTPAPTQNSVTAAPTGVDEHNGSPEATGGPNENVTVTLADAHGTGIPNLTVELVAGNATTGTLMTTDGSGTAVFPVGLDPTASNLTVTYTALDVSDNYRAIGTVTVTYVPIPDEQHESTVVPAVQSVYTYDASQPAATQTAYLHVTLLDANGLPLVGNDVTLGASSPFATITPVATENGVTPGISDSNGQALFAVTDCNPGGLPCAPETVTFTVTDNSTGAVLIDQPQVSFVLRPDENVTSTIVASPTLVEADGHSSTVVTVTLRNNGTLLSGNTVSLSQGQGHANITTLDPVSNAAGQVRFKVTDLTAESVALQATDLTTATELTHDAVVTFSAPPGGSLRPTVSSLTPTSGPGTGGTNVTLTGGNFSNASSVLFGSVPATTFSIAPSGTQLVAVSPIPLSAGSVNVTVVGPGGTSDVGPGDVFTYTSAPPLSLANVSPNWGALSGATHVTLGGTGLLGAQSVHFGTQAARFTVSNGGATLNAVAPATTAPGSVIVTVTTATGTSSVTLMDRFAYVGHTAPAGPSIVGVTPATGPIHGGNLVTIRGLWLNNVSSVTFGAARAAVISVNASHTLVRVRVPAAVRAGTVNVTVRTTAGTSVHTSVDRYTYQSATHHAKVRVRARAPLHHLVTPTAGSGPVRNAARTSQEGSPS